MLHDHFGEEIARRYDADSAEMSRPETVDPAVDFLAALAGSGPVLELGIGTGRIALPLAGRGLAVHGIDLSAAMVARLRTKPGGTEIPVVIGDFATTPVGSGFALTYLVFNTIMNLTTLDAQVECFERVARQLAPGGRFVIEVMVPQLQKLAPGETVRPFAIGSDHFGFDEYEVATQRLVSHHYTSVDGQLEVRSTPFRYVWPSELDLMARLAGMTAVERWATWTRDPFLSDSEQHISVWANPG